MPKCDGWYFTGSVTSGAPSDERGGVGARGQRNRLDFGVLAESLDAELAPDSRLLAPAEGQREVEHVPVHAERAGPDPRRDIERAVEIGREHRPGQPVARVVGDAHRVVVAVVRDDRENGAE